MKTELYQIWIRRWDANCSHTETVYLKATSVDDAFARADALFRETHAIKFASADQEEWLDQEACGCGNSITVEV